eukprot:5647221-Alexandrium_andersonii.AAC.1
MQAIARAPVPCVACDRVAACEACPSTPDQQHQQQQESSSSDGRAAVTTAAATTLFSDSPSAPIAFDVD